MSYDSIDKLQLALANTTFKNRKDSKKAAGRALGTFVEIITYYFFKLIGLQHNICIEYKIPEYANMDITHNVEFTLHGSELVYEYKYNLEKLPIKANKIFNDNKNILKINNVNLIDKNNIIYNAKRLCYDDKFIYNAYVNTDEQFIKIYKLVNRPFAMFECKRVGVEAGNKKGPQTIEKAKQGAYVSRVVSSFQKIRNYDGTLLGVLSNNNSGFSLFNYYDKLDEIISTSKLELLKDFILTIGIVSNHGNWFTSDNPNKELKILSQSYDYLLFLTDNGITQFIETLLLSNKKEYDDIKYAFKESYSPSIKNVNIFTKSKIYLKADIALNKYFYNNFENIKKWFNVISPKGLDLDSIIVNIKKLLEKDWKEVYK